MLRLWRLNNEQGRATTQENPYSISFQWIDSLVFVDQDEKMPLVLRGQLALKVSRSVTTPLVSLKFEGLSRFGKSKNIRKSKLISEGWQYIWPRNAQERKLDAESGIYEAGFSPCQYHDDWIPTIKPALQWNFRDLIKKPRIQFGGQSSSPETYLHPGTYSIEFEIPVFAKLPVTLHHEKLKVSYFLIAECINERPNSPRATFSVPITVLQAPSLVPLLDQIPAPLVFRWIDGTRISISIERNAAPLNGSLSIFICARSRNFIQELKVSINVTEAVAKSRRLENGFQHQPWLTKRLCRIAKKPGYDITTIRKDNESSKQNCLVGETKTSFSKRSADHEIHCAGSSFAQDYWRLEMDLNVPLPKCAMHSGLKAVDFMNFDISERQLQISHLLEFDAEIVLFAGKGSIPKHRKFNGNVPFQLLPCEAQDSNIWLPRYPT